MTVEIKITAANPTEFEEAMKTLGYVRSDAIPARMRPLPGGIATGNSGSPTEEVAAFAAAQQRETIMSQRQAEALGLVTELHIPSAGGSTDGTPIYATGDTVSIAPPEGYIVSAFGGFRKHGEPSPGRKRRTAIEVGEDMRYAAEQKAKREAAAATYAAGPSDEAETSLFDSDEPAISTGDERLDPEQAAEQAALDAEDEAAESEDTGELTHDDLRQAVGRFAHVVGVARAAKEVKGILGCGVEQVPATQEALSEAIEKIEVATKGQGGETAGGAQSGPPAPEAATAVTRDQVVNLIKRYALTYDGTDDFSKAPFTAEDVGSIVQAVAGVKALSKIPDTPEMNRTLFAAIEEAFINNPFKRKVVRR